MRDRKIPKDLEPACFYLRKSREDQEAEARGEGETLAKHKKALFKLAKEYEVHISKVFEELVSGESIIHRPAVIELLKEVEQRKWKSVWCMDIDRLGRGKMQDQGLIIDTFKDSHTKIVTPRKIYDLDDDLDEEYTEFEAFMARKELKIITRRLQGGRLRSLDDGNYIGAVPPYGYLIENKNNKRYLIKHPEQSEPTNFIFSMYLTGGLGTNKIANELNRMGYKTYHGKRWTGSSILNMLKNPVYAGITAWRKKEVKRSIIPGKKKASRTRPRDQQLWVYDTHEAYITEDEFSQVQNMISTKYHPPYQLINGISNPLAGIVKCAICNSSMIYRSYTHQKYPHLMCYNRYCPNKSARFEYVEKALISGLEEWLNEYRLQWGDNLYHDDHSSTIKAKEKAVQNLYKELGELKQQKDKLYDLIEKGLYDETTYLERSKKLSLNILEIQGAITETEIVLKNEILRNRARKDIIPKLEKILSVYKTTLAPESKNKMLKSLLEYATYHKEKHQKGDDFTMVLYPIL